MNWFGRPSCYLYMPNTEFTFYTFFHTYVIYTCFILTLSVTLGPFVLSAPRRPGTTKRRASAVSRSMMKANFLRRTSEITWLKLKPMVSLEWLSRVFVVNRNWATWGVAKWLVVSSCRYDFVWKAVGAIILSLRYITGADLEIFKTLGGGGFSVGGWMGRLPCTYVMLMNLISRE